MARHPELSKVLRVEVKGNAELGDEAQMLADCRQSVIDMMAGTVSVAGTFCPEVGVLDIPFVFRSVDRGRAAFDGPIGKEYAELMAAKDIHVIAWFENGVRNFTANRPIREPADLKGLKLRVPQSEVSIASFKAFGADAKALPFNQVFEALRTGEFEAQENPIKSIEDANFFQVQKYLSLTGHAYSTGILVASPDLVEDLSGPQITALRTCAFEGTLKSRQTAETAVRDGVGRLKTLGMTIIEDVNLAAFVSVFRPNIEEFGKTFGHDRIQHLMSAAV